MSAVALEHCEKYPIHVYEVKPRKDRRGVDLISDALPLGALCITGKEKRRKFPPPVAR